MYSRHRRELHRSELMASTQRERADAGAPAATATAPAPPPPPPSQQRPRALVIGAGFAGAALATRLAAGGLVDVTLVDRKPYFEVAYANARALVDPSLAERVVVDVAELKPHGEFVCGEVTELTPSEAVLADGRRLGFDFAAVCAGSAQPPWKGAAPTAAARREELRALAAALRAAPAVVVVGGGSLGVEVAGEVAAARPGVPLFVVHSGPHLMERLPARAHRLAAGWLEARGCS